MTSRPELLKDLSPPAATAIVSFAMKILAFKPLSTKMHINVHDALKQSVVHEGARR